MVSTLQLAFHSCIAALLLWTFPKWVLFGTVEAYYALACDLGLPCAGPAAGPSNRTSGNQSANAMDHAQTVVCCVTNL